MEKKLIKKENNGKDKSIINGEYSNWEKNDKIIKYNNDGQLKVNGEYLNKKILEKKNIKIMVNYYVKENI